MADASTRGEEFLEEVEAVILDNVSSEQFGVSELAEAMSMSRSNLLRKIKKHTNLSASQFIRQVRLKKGMELLEQTSLTVSEVSYQVGFGSTSYFIKCYRERFGNAPGEARKGTAETSVNVHSLKPYRWSAIIAVSTVLLIASYLFFKKLSSSGVEPEKSVAVLPFKNESSDSSNLYFVNGLMEAALSNLQKIKDLRVVSRTSVEQFRDTNTPIPEIAETLHVSYIVEGSGQRVGDRVLLNIQLIDASRDQPIWAKQYSRKVVDVFALQNEVAREIADAIKVIVTPAELERIERKPTENMVAYDYYLQALDPFLTRTHEGLERAIPLFEKAIEHDPEFALAYAGLAISYYFLDIYQVNKQYTGQISNYADKALLYDAKSAESLTAKAFYYMHRKEFRLALPYLEKALEYNPNSSFVVQMLSDFYARITPNTAKYLEYALKGIQLDAGGSDSTTKSYTYLHLSNALIQAGFVDESIKYIDLSLDYNPQNEYAPYVKPLILYAKHKDIARTQRALEKVWQKDTTRLDILQEVAKTFYFQEKYDSAFYYYQKFVKARESRGLDIYAHDDVKIGMVYKQMGYTAQAADFFRAYANYCDNDESIYKSASMAVKYAYEGKPDLAIEQLNLFAAQDNYQYWILLFLELDPIIQPLKSHPGFKKVMEKINAHFWVDHAKLKESLEVKGLLTT
ncbi:helix-turn-helix domain-containing protein [Pontibacter mangrovi]|uniref:Helix-turn-helix domain-containing protein n=1 Tax=Pontibacter mangrovi TaxID=2589816 RepID=A0A501WA10_9BACT|nr:helix-turn-helix domain-containing protein [Pontibacter mangrovi]TPE42406.1 helix-turn-helix domain-containing protein [Pontibacter mangrovi]